MKPAWVALVCLTACAPYEVDDARRDLLQSWGDDVLLPTYDDVYARAGELHDAAVDVCADPDQPALDAARDAWMAARGPWKRTEIFAFGPYKEEPLRLGPKIDAWPARPDTVDEILADDIELTEQAVDSFGVYARGFPAIEYLLFQPDIDVLAELVATPRRCEYVVAASANLVAEVGELRDAWDPVAGDYLAQLTGAGKTSTEFDTLPDALGEVVNRMGFTAENIHVDKLGRPAGVTSGDGTPQPELAESQFSGRSIDDVRDNLTGIDILYFGDEASLGLRGYMAKRGYYFDTDMRARLDAADAALTAIDGTLLEAIVDDRDAVLEAIDRVTDLQELLQTEVIPALSLTVGFNDVDGD